MALSQSLKTVLKDLDIGGTTLGVLIGGQVAQTTEVLITHLLLPTIEPVLSKIKTDTKIMIGPIKIQIQPILQSLIKLILIAIIVAIMAHLGLIIRKPVTWVSVRSLAPGVKL